MTYRYSVVADTSSDRASGDDNNLIMQYSFSALISWFPFVLLLFFILRTMIGGHQMRRILPRGSCNIDTQPPTPTRLPTPSYNPTKTVTPGLFTQPDFLFPFFFPPLCIKKSRSGLLYFVPTATGPLVHDPTAQLHHSSQPRPDHEHYLNL